jgi:hypothetical protein
MNFEYEMTNDMTSVITNDFTGSNRPTNTVVATANELSQRLANAKDELSAAIENADLEQMTALRAEIKSLPEKITIAEIRELKLRLKEIELEKEKNAENIKLINAVRRQKNMEYAEKVRELEPYAAAVNEWDIKLSFANNDTALLLGEKRQKKSKLFNLSESMRETF